MQFPRRGLVHTVGLAGVVWGAAACSSSGSDRGAPVTPVSPTAVASVTLTPATGSLNVSASLTVHAQVKNAQGAVIPGAKVTFKSSDTTKATVSAAGVVAAIAPGSVIIKGTSGTQSGTAALTLDPITDNWTTYGHDAQRTGASWASLTGPLTLAWHYVPTGAPSHAVAQVLYALGRTDLVVLRAELITNYGYGITPGADRVSTAGQHVWTYVMGTDADFGNWSAILGNYVVFNDDGVRYVNLSTGASVHGGGVDSWGELLADSSTLYLESDAQIDGPGVYVGAYDTTAKSLWQANKFATCRGSSAALAGGMAVSNGTLFYAPNYQKGTDSTALPYASGVYAFNATTGVKTAFHASTPYSRLSADNANVYLVESQNALVARAQSDLHTVWSVPESGPGEQAPVLADSLVIIGTSAGVEAHSPATGAIVWSTPIANVDAHWSETYQSGSCGLIEIPVAGYSSATMAAALSSRTLVVTAPDGLHILSLATGTDLWHGTPSGVTTQIGNPIIVNDPVKGGTVYVTDYQGLYALTQ
jgi:hypothetical protein